MTVRSLRAPTRIGDTIEDVSGVRYISWDAVSWNLYRINEDNGIEGGTTTTPGDDSMDYEELFAEISNGAYGLPTTLSNGNLSITINSINYFIVFETMTVGGRTYPYTFRTGSETGTILLPRQ